MPDESDQPVAEVDTFQAILDSLDEGVLTLDDAGTVLDLNRAACDILGVDRDQARQRGCPFLMGDEVCSQSSRVRQSIAQRKPIRDLQAEVWTTTGQRKVLNVRTSVLRGPDRQPRGGLIVFRDVTELARLRQDLHERYQLHNIIGKSRPMQVVFELVEQVADSTASVLIEGETGTGKELVARAIHHLGPRAGGPFRRGELLRPARITPGERTLRTRTRCVHRCRPRQAGPIPGGRRRHDLP